MKTGRITIEELNASIQSKLERIDNIGQHFAALSNKVDQINDKTDQTQNTVATTSKNGLMTAEDKKKLDSLTTTPNANAVKVSNSQNIFTSTDLQVVLEELKKDTRIVKNITFSGVSAKDTKTGLFKTIINPPAAYSINANTVVNINIHPQYLEDYSFILPVTESYDDGSFALFSTDALTASHSFKYDMILLKGVN